MSEGERSSALVRLKPNEKSYSEPVKNNRTVCSISILYEYLWSGFITRRLCPLAHAYTEDTHTVGQTVTLKVCSLQQPLGHILYKHWNRTGVICLHTCIQKGDGSCSSMLCTYTVDVEMQGEGKTVTLLLVHGCSCRWGNYNHRDHNALLHEWNSWSISTLLKGTPFWSSEELKMPGITRMTPKCFRTNKETNTKCTWIASWSCKLYFINNGTQLKLRYASCMLCFTGSKINLLHTMQESNDMCVCMCVYHTCAVTAG